MIEADAFFGKHILHHRPDRRIGDHAVRCRHRQFQGSELRPQFHREALRKNHFPDQIAAAAERAVRLRVTADQPSRENLIEQKRLIRIERHLQPVFVDGGQGPGVRPLEGFGGQNLQDLSVRTERLIRHLAPAPPVVQHGGLERALPRRVPSGRLEEQPQRALALAQKDRFSHETATVTGRAEALVVEVIRKAVAARGCGGVAHSRRFARRDVPQGDPEAVSANIPGGQGPA